MDYWAPRSARRCDPMHFYVMLDRELSLRLYERTAAASFRYAELRPNEIVEGSTRSSVLVADPLLSEHAFRVCSGILTGPASWSLVCYTRLSPHAAHRLVALARKGFFRLVLFDHDDSPLQLSSTLADEGSQSIPKHVLDLIAPQTEQLDERLQRAVSDLFRSPSRYSATYDLASAAGVSKPSMYRAFARAGLCSPKRLIAAARVARLAGVAILGRQSLPLSRARAGYRDPRVLRSDLRLTLACTLKSLQSRLDTDIAGELANFVTHRSGIAHNPYS